MEQRAGPPRNDRFKLNKEAVLTYPLKRIVMEGKHEHIRTKSKQHGIYFFNDPFRYKRQQETAVIQYDFIVS